MSPSVKMQLFLRAQNTHTLEVTGEETVGAIKVKKKTCPQCAVMCWASVAVIIHRKDTGAKLFFAVYFRPTYRLLRVSWLKTRCCCSLDAHWRMTPPWRPVASRSTVPWRWLEGFLEVGLDSLTAPECVFFNLYKVNRWPVSH